MIWRQTLGTPANAVPESAEDAIPRTPLTLERTELFDLGGLEDEGEVGGSRGGGATDAGTMSRDCVPLSPPDESSLVRVI